MGLALLFARRSPFAKTRFVTSFTAEFNNERNDAECHAREAIAELQHGRPLDVEAGSAQSVPYGSGQPGSANHPDWSLAHPWIEAILPWRNAGRCVTRVLADLPPTLPYNTGVLLWSAPRARFTSPMLKLPDSELLLGFALLPAVEPGRLPQLLRRLEAAGKQLTALGGKHYLSGWIDYNPRQWREHFGDLWPQVVEWKAMFDPGGILNPGLVPLSTEPGR